MKCTACGYSGNDHVGYVDKDGNEGGPFIELAIVERGPFFAGTPYDWPAGKSGAPAIRRGTPTKMLACPQCGTVRIEP